MNFYPSSFSTGCVDVLSLTDSFDTINDGDNSTCAEMDSWGGAFTEMGFVLVSTTFWDVHSAVCTAVPTPRLLRWRL